MDPTAGWEHSNCRRFRDIALGGWEVAAKKKKKEIKRRKKVEKKKKPKIST